VDRGWVASTLRAACEFAEVPSEEFIDGVIAGLEIGREQYGEYAYRGRKNTKEGRYEARDAAAYALMEMTDARESFERGEMTAEAVVAQEIDLLRVIVLAAQIDQRFASARQARLAA
jgi:hypothetical protein